MNKTEKRHDAGVEKEYADQYGEYLYTLERSIRRKVNEPRTKRRPGIWCFDETDDGTLVVHFSCPRCSGINQVSQDDCYDAGQVESNDGNRTFFSFMCGKCHRHLWVHFRGSKW